MQLRSNLWKTFAASGNVKMEAVVEIGGQEYAPEGDVIVNRALGQNALSIGNAVTATVEFSIEAPENVTIPNASAAVVKVRYVDGGRVSEWLTAGVFYVSRRNQNVVSNALEFQGYDTMIKADAPYPSLSGFPKAMNSAAMEIARNMGVEIDGRTWAGFPTGNDYYVPLPANGEKMIGVLGYIGGVCGGNWIITPQGKLRLVPLVSASGAMDAEDRAEIAAIMGGVTTGRGVTVTGVAVSGQNGMIAGTEAGAVVSMARNPYITQASLNALLARYGGLTYAPYEIRGGIYDPAAEIGDYLTSREDVASVIWAEKATYAPMFRGDISAPFASETSGSEQSISDAISETGGGYEDLSVRFYKFVNQAAVSVGDGQSAEIVNFDYAAGAGQDVVFHAEIKHATATTETGNAATGWIENDAVLTVTYYINGAAVTAYQPVKTETDGANLLHLNYQWENGKYETGNFRAVLSLSGGAVSIAAGDARAHIIGQGYAGGVGEWVTEDGLVFIGAESYPKLDYEYGETLDLTGLVVKAYYADGTEKDVTAQCAISPAHGDAPEDGETVVNVSYAEGGKTFADSFSVYCSGDGYRVLYIEVEQPPNKTEYFVGEKLDLGGIVVVAVQENGWVVRNIKPDCVFSPAEGDALTEPGTVTVTVARSYLFPLDYGTFTAYFDVNVRDPEAIASGDGWTLYDSGLLDIYYEGDMPDYIFGDSPWYEYRAQITGATIGDSVTSIGNSAFYGCASLTSVTIGDSVRSIGAGAFAGCTSLTSVVIPDSVTSIGNNAFSRCTSLASVVIPNSVTSIVYSVFESCSALTSVVIPDSVTSIGNSAFSRCTSLASVTIGDSVRSIGAGAFANCTSLTSVVIPDSVTSVGDNAFYNCYRLADVYYGGSQEQWGAISISLTGNSNLTSNATIHYNSAGPT